MSGSNLVEWAVDTPFNSFWFGGDVVRAVYRAIADTFGFWNFGEIRTVVWLVASVSETRGLLYRKVKAERTSSK